MQVSISTRDDIEIATISGEIHRHAAGSLFDALVAAVGDGDKNLIIDLSGVALMTSAGMRGLVVAARLLQSTGGAMRLCGAQASVADFLRQRGHNHLLRCDPTLEDSVSALNGGSEVGNAIAPPDANTTHIRTRQSAFSRESGLTVDHFTRVRRGEISPLTFGCDEHNASEWSDAVPFTPQIQTADQRRKKA